jgi:hypothetical protein
MHHAKVCVGASRDEAQHPISLLPPEHGVSGLVHRQRAVVQSQRARAVVQPVVARERGALCSRVLSAPTGMPSAPAASSYESPRR